VPLSQLVVLCRLGFEAEAAQELIERAAEFDVELTRDDEPQQAFVVLHARSGDTGKLVQAIDFHSLVFARQWFACDELIELPRQDRLTVLMDAARALGTFGNVWFETADTNDAKALGSLGQALYKPFSSLVKKEGLWQPGTQARLHVMLTSGTTAYVGVSYPPNSAAAMGGIPRLKVSREAPSRSATKLDEAIHWFLDEGKKSDQPSLFVPGSWAVDLGAAPGGWTFQLVQRGINVMAVDNGPMNPDLMNSGFVRHYKQDGYTFQPPKPVAWMVCDIADKPARTIDMVAEWLTKGWCQRTIFNLKLPMKQRYAEVQHLLSRLSHKVAHQLPQAQLTLAAKQLYHNREEITVYASIFVKK
jgi:23S rRNA (cytidine2498-2'-O)-methyltransferase